MAEDIRTNIRNEVAALAAQCGNPDATIADDDIIPESGLLDSAAIIELINWIEQRFKIVLDEDEITVDNLGSINLIVAFVQARNAG